MKLVEALLRQATGHLLDDLTQDFVDDAVPLLFDLLTTSSAAAAAKVIQQLYNADDYGIMLSVTLNFRRVDAQQLAA